MQGLLVHKVDPVAPAGGRIRGVAVVSAVIGRDGSVINVRPVSGPEALTRAAMDSVQWWKFEPYRQNGVPRGSRDFAGHRVPLDFSRKKLLAIVKDRSSLRCDAALANSVQYNKAAEAEASHGDERCYLVEVRAQA